MKNFFVPLFLFLFSFHNCFAQDALNIMQEQDKRARGFQTEISTGQMEIISSSGSKQSRRFSYEVLEKTNQNGEKSRLTILEPHDLRNVSLLSHDQKDKDDDQWLFLPSMNRTKRIIGSAKQGRFIGSDFTYEDLRTRDINDYNYRFVTTQTCENRQCYVIEATPKFSDSLYAKTIMMIDTQNYQTLSSDFYNAKGEKVKHADFSDMKQINSFTRAHAIIMSDLLTKRKTVLKFESIVLGTPLAHERFSSQSLGSSL